MKQINTTFCYNVEKTYSSEEITDNKIEIKMKY